METLLALATSNNTLLTVSIINITATLAAAGAFLCNLHYQTGSLAAPTVYAIRLICIAAMAGSSATLLTTAIIAATTNGFEGTPPSGRLISVFCTAVMAVPFTVLFHLHRPYPAPVPTSQE